MRKTVLLLMLLYVKTYAQPFDRTADQQQGAYKHFYGVAKNTYTDYLIKKTFAQSAVEKLNLLLPNGVAGQRAEKLYLLGYLVGQACNFELTGGDVTSWTPEHEASFLKGLDTLDTMHTDSDRAIAYAHVLSQLKIMYPNGLPNPLPQGFNEEIVLYSRYDTDNAPDTSAELQVSN